MISVGKKFKSALLKSVHLDGMILLIKACSREFNWRREQAMANKSKFISEFKEFISRGSVVDLAVGVIIGSAFTAIVTSLVNDIVMPIIGLLFGGIDFQNLKIVIAHATGTTPEAAIRYGMFIQSVFNFLLIALVIFSIIKAINSLKRSEEKSAEEAPAPEENVVLLREIRDLLKAETQNK